MLYLLMSYWHSLYSADALPPPCHTDILYISADALPPTCHTDILYISADALPPPCHTSLYQRWCSTSSMSLTLFISALMLYLLHVILTLFFISDALPPPCHTDILYISADALPLHVILTLTPPTFLSFRLLTSFFLQEPHLDGLLGITGCWISKVCGLSAIKLPICFESHYFTTSFVSYEV